MSLRARDTLRLVPRYMIDAVCSAKPFMFGTNSYDVIKGSNSLTSGSSVTENYKLNLNTSMTLNFNYLISKQFKKSNQFYIGVALNYTGYQVIHTLYQYSEQGSGKPNYTSYDYSQYEFNHTCNAISIGPNLSYYVLFKRLVLMNRLGVYLTENFSNNSIGYNEKEYVSGPKTDPAYITSSNPEGWYYSKDLISITSKQDQIDDISFNLFYNVGLGIRIKKVIPLVNIEVTRLSKTFNNPFIKLQIGISYLF